MCNQMEMNATHSMENRFETNHSFIVVNIGFSWSFSLTTLYAQLYLCGCTYGMISKNLTLFIDGKFMIF